MKENQNNIAEDGKVVVAVVAELAGDVRSTPLSGSDKPLTIGSEVFLGDTVSVASCNSPICFGLKIKVRVII